jgi:hypothetical protein
MGDCRLCNDTGWRCKPAGKGKLACLCAAAPTAIERFLYFYERHKHGSLLLELDILTTEGCEGDRGCCADSFDCSDLIDELKDLTDWEQP